MLPWSKPNNSHDCYQKVEWFADETGFHPSAPFLPKSVEPNHPEVAAAAKDLALADVTVGEYLTNKYALWLDMRTNDDDSLHGSGRSIENASEGVTVQITKRAETSGTLNMYLYVIMDAQINIENGRFINALY